MRALLTICRWIDTINLWIGRTVAWLVLVAIGVSTVNAVIRKLFDAGSNAWLEAQWYMFSAVFLLCAAWTLLRNEHIRIDIVSSHLTPRTRNWIDVFGFSAFLIPLCVVMLIESWPYFYDTWLSGERSSNAGGLIRWPARLLIVLGFSLLLAQGISELIKRLAIAKGDLPPDVRQAGHH